MEKNVKFFLRNDNINRRNKKGFPIWEPPDY